MPRFFIALSFFSVLLGCASTSRFDSRIDKRSTPPIPSFLAKWKLAPTAELEKLQVGTNEDNILWWKTYVLALKKKASAPTESCTAFTQLASATKFPLQDLALLRAHEVCSDTSKLEQLPTSVPNWYRELFIDLSLKESQKTPEVLDDIEAYKAKARLESNKKNKEDFYLKALELAKKLELKDQIEEIETQLYRNSPRLIPAPNFKDFSAVASDYRYHRSFEQALDTYQKILKNKKSSAKEQFFALKNIRQTYKVAQNRNEYIKATGELVKWTKKQFQKNKKDRQSISRFHDAQILYAKTLWTEDQTSKAVKVLHETRDLLNKIHPLDEVYFILGRIDEEKGRFEKALEYFEKSYQEPVSAEGLRDKISWLKSWNYFKLNKFMEAKKSFEEMKDSVEDPSDKSRARFWLARTLTKLNLINEAQAELKALQNEDPLGYYGVLAYRELNEKIPPFKTAPDEMQQLNLFSISELDRNTRLSAEWLIAVGEKSIAEKILNSAVEDLKKDKVQEEQVWLIIASSYARTGLYLPLFAAISDLDSEVKDRLLKDHPDLLFPQAFQGIILDASKKSGIPPEFIFSIIRQESAFNPEARSPADAFGLMQLLPSVAKQLAKKNNLAYSEAQDLFTPEINIPLGAIELKTLMKRYNNQFILAVSGYNANGSAIRGWLKTRFREDAVEFIEEVPYEETRTYIKLVMRNYIFYRRLLNQDLAQPFPEELLRLKK